MKVEKENLIKNSTIFKVLASNHKVGAVLSVKGNILTDEPNEYLVTSAQYESQTFKSIDFAVKAYNLIVGA